MRPGRLHPRLRHALERRGVAALRAFVRRSGDRRLERTIGTRAGLRALFSAMEARFVPAAASGLTGDLLFELRSADGRVQPWTVSITPDRARARPGRPADPRLTVRLGVADFARVASGDLDPGRGLLSGRIDVQGEFPLAARLGEMFGRDGR